MLNQKGRKISARRTGSPPWLRTKYVLDHRDILFPNKKSKRVLNHRDFFLFSHAYVVS